MFFCVLAVFWGHVFSESSLTGTFSLVQIYDQVDTIENDAEDNETLNAIVCFCWFFVIFVKPMGAVCVTTS